VVFRAVGWLCWVSLRVGLSVIFEFCVLETGSFPYRFRGLWKLWLGRLAAAEGCLSGIGFCRSLHCWRFVWLGFLASSSVRFCWAVVGWFFCRPLPACRDWVCAAAFRRSGRVVVFVVAGLVGLQAFCHDWPGGFLARCGGCFRLVAGGCCQSGGVAVSALCGSAVWRVFRVRAKRHPHAQQASQRDCPPFRLAKFLFFTGKRLRCSHSSGQPLTVTLFPTNGAQSSIKTKT